MDFDEYEYLEKTVENQDDRENSFKSKKIKDGGSEKIEKRYRKRDIDEDVDGEDRRSKKSRGGDEENGSIKERDRDDKDRSSRRDRDRRRSSREGDREREGEREKDRDRERSSRDKDRESEKDKEKERRDRDRDREKERRDGDKEKYIEERERESSRSRRSRSHSQRSRSPPRRSSSRSRRSSSRSRRHDIDFDRERGVEFWDTRRLKEKKEVGEPEADPERDQRTVFAYQMPLKATERDVFEFFSKAGKVRDVKLIMDRNSRRSKGVGNAIMMRDDGKTLHSCFINSCCVSKVQLFWLRKKNKGYCGCTADPVDFNIDVTHRYKFSVGYLLDKSFLSREVLVGIDLRGHLWF